MVSRLKNREKFSFMRETMESWNVGFRRNHRSLTLHPSNREVKAQTGFVPDSTLRSRWKFFFFPMKKEPGAGEKGHGKELVLNTQTLIAEKSLCLARCLTSPGQGLTE